MGSTKLYIPITTLSFIILLTTCLSILSESQEPGYFSPEFENVIHSELDSTLTNENVSELKKTFFPSAVVVKSVKINNI